MTIGEKTSAPLDEWEGVGVTGKKFEEQRKQLLAGGYIKGADTLVKMEITFSSMSEESFVTVTDTYFFVVRQSSDEFKVIAELLPVDGKASYSTSLPIAVLRPVEGKANEIKKRDAAAKSEK